VAIPRLRLIPSPAPQKGSDEACLEAFQKELDYIYRTLQRLGTLASEVEDLAQDLFLALRRCWSAYDPTRPLRPYLFGIAFRIVLAHQRKRGREVLFGVLDANDAGPGPDDALQTKEARAMLLAALERIPLPRRAVLIMHDVDSVPAREVASRLQIPLFTVYSRLRKARSELDIALRRIMRQVAVA
jgi:RNA polymerase sigma-70 factor (ECF subfamily)